MFPFNEADNYRTFKQHDPMQEPSFVSGKCSDSSQGSLESTISQEDLSLTLGFSKKCQPFEERGSSLRNGNLSGMYMNGKLAPMDLGLGLTPSNQHDLYTKSMEKTFTGVSSMKEASGTHEEENHGATHPSSAGGSKGIYAYRLKDHNSAAAYREDNTEVELQLGLLVFPDSSNDLNVMPLCNGDARTCGRDFFLSGEHIAVIDEGSTSAKLAKTEKGYKMASPLRGRSVRVSSLLSKMSKIPEVMDERVRNPLSSEGMNISSVHGGVVLSDLNEQIGNISSSYDSQALHVTSERSTKACKVTGCAKGARGASGLCIAHGGGRRCQRPNCNRGAEGRTMFCKAHGGGRRCQSLGCIKSAEGKTEFCIAHGGGKRCTYDGCSKAARGKSGLCIRHGGGKRCQKEGCTRSAEGFSGLCISHGGGRRCQYPDCSKGAQGSTMFCKAHGGGRRCEFEGCTKGAEGSTPFCKAHGGGKRCAYGGGTCTKSVHGGTLFCVAHGGGKRCAIAMCTKSARGRTDYCVKHGGGKRCKFNSCSKSAQGSTDYCKAHGGGKRCRWGLAESAQIGCDNGVPDPCDKFARGKLGLCSTHSILAERSGHSVSMSNSQKGAVESCSPIPDVVSYPQSSGAAGLGKRGSIHGEHNAMGSDTDIVRRSVFKAHGTCQITSQEDGTDDRVQVCQNYLMRQRSWGAGNGFAGGQGRTQDPSSSGAACNNVLSWSDPEGRVHGGEHFVTLFSNKGDVRHP